MRSFHNYNFSPVPTQFKESSAQVAIEGKFKERGHFFFWLSMSQEQKDPVRRGPSGFAEMV